MSWRIGRAVPVALLFGSLIATAGAQAQRASSPQTSLAASAAPSAAAAIADTVPPVVERDPLLAEDNLLLFDVSLDRLAITDSLATYDVPGGPLIPLGELSRLLDVDLAVSVAQRRVTGSVGEARRPVVIDVASGLMRVGGVATPLAPGDVVVGPVDLYVRPALLERLLPVSVTVDTAALRMALAPREPLPIQSRLDRLAWLRELRPDIGEHGEPLRLALPPHLISPPSFDVTLAGSINSRAPTRSTRYDIRAGADLFYTGFQGYVGSDDRGVARTVRALFERRDPRGRLFGGLGVTRASAGDVFTPTMAIGPRSIGGRGASFTTAPLEQANVFERIDLRGELPIGYDVELYINDVLRSGQDRPVQGRYEFLDVPLVRGTNVIRIVSNGPRGERNEEVRIVSVGSGQVPKGHAIVDVGVVQQDRQLIDPSGREIAGFASPGRSRMRVAANVAYGVSTAVTLTGGVGLYSPNGDASRRLITLGMRTSLLGWAVQGDSARDSRGGGALALGVAGRPFGISIIVRHAEYRGGFIDETAPTGNDDRPLARATAIDLDLSALPLAGRSLPVSARIQRDAFTNGDGELAVAVRTSSSLGRALVSTGLDYRRRSVRGRAVGDRLTGTVSASLFAAFAWQLRAAVEYDVLPSTHLRAAIVTTDRSISAHAAVRLGLSHSFEDDKGTMAQASAIFRLPFGDVSIDGGYGAPRHDWRIGFAVAFSLGWDPLAHRYAARRIGAGTGGNLALQAFADTNGNGRYDRGEAPVAGVVLNGGVAEATTDVSGRAYLSGLGYAAVARVQANVDDIAIADVAAVAKTIEFTPRAGVAAVALYPLRAQGEVFVRLLFRQPDGQMAGLSAVRLRAIARDGRVTEVATEYDGSAAFDMLMAGPYRVEIEPTQAARLAMHLTVPIAFVIPPGGGPLPDIRAVIAFGGR